MNVRAENLQKKFGWMMALDKVNLDVDAGNIVAVLGPNGAGKTTLMNALAGVLPLDGGQVLFDGQGYTPNRGDLRRRFAFIPDVPPVPSNWTPLRFIATTLKLYETPMDGAEQRVCELLEALDLLGVARWRFFRLSRGQIYKAVLAAFLAADPEVWLVDEPFASGMDPRGLNCFKEYARAGVKRGRTIIFTTQIIEVAEQFADYICVLDHGQVQAFIEPSKLQGASQLLAMLTNLREKPRL